MGRASGGRVTGFGSDFAHNAADHDSGGDADLTSLFLPIPGAPTTYTQTYSTADATLGAYTPDTESSSYVGDGGGVATVSAAANVAQLSDLNNLRVAYENLRVFTEDLAQVVNKLVDDLQASGYAN